MGGAAAAGSIERLCITSATYKLVAALFDTQFYLTNYQDVRESGADPIAHYLEFGWKEGRDPSPSFSTAAYLKANPQVEQSGECPLIEYVTHGIFADLPAQSAPEIVRRQVAAAFDAGYYLEIYPDVAAKGIDPLQHYLEHGCREDRDPSPGFDTKYYLEANPDVREMGICPLVHYVTSGAAEGRLPQRPRNPARMAVNSALARSERMKPWLHPLPSEPINGSALQQALRRLREPAIKGMALTLSHDDYRSNVGGVQNCVADEERGFNEAGWAYLHACLAQPLPVLADPTPAADFFVSVRANGAQIGIVSIATLISELGHAGLGEVRRVLVLQHLLGFCPELVAELAAAFVPEKTIAWVHDFFTLCPNAIMLRNNVAFCGGPHPDSPACGICVYGGDERKQHLARMDSLFGALKPDVLAPSESALKFWLTRGSLRHAAAKVIPHGKLLMEPTPRPVSMRDQLNLRVAFCGHAAFHKGFHVYEDLASRHSHDSRYSFFHLGSTHPKVARNITFIPVEVSTAQRHRMTDTLIANEIDVVVNWSLCHETFCFTAYEAMAAGAFVLAPTRAGNITPAITQRDIEQGLGLDSEEALFELFSSGELFGLVMRRRYGEFQVRAGSVRYLEGS